MMSLLWKLIRQDFIDRYSGSALGILWALMMPISQIILFTLIFTHLFAARLPGSNSVYDYGIYLVSGILPWLAFNSTISRLADILNSKRSILSKVHVDLKIYFLHVVVAETIVLFLVISVFCAVLVVTGRLSFGISFLILPYIFFQQLLAFSVGTILSIGSIFFRDVRESLPIFFQFWFWATPIVYVLNQKQGILATFQIVNPAYWIVSGYQSIIVFNKLPPLQPFLILVVTSLSLCLLTLYILKRGERVIRDTF
jgi:lipopolysaccharide transport system permease protein